MEKIRSAIAKARVERDAITAAQPILQRGDMSDSNSISDTVGANWAALPKATFDADLMRHNRIVAYQRGSNSTSIDMMRTRIMQQMRDNNWRRLAITSPTSDCGKSTVALNLAVSLSRQADLRTLLLELDLRRPSLMRMLGSGPIVANFADVLRGRASFANNALCYCGNLAVGANSGRTSDSAELLAGDGVGDVLSHIEADYQPHLVIFDMPPMLAADDMMAFATQVDCVLIIAAAERTTTKEIDLCEQELARQTNVMGVVLNECRYMGPQDNYGYYG